MSIDNINKLFSFGLQLDMDISKGRLTRWHEGYKKEATMAYDELSLVWSTFNEETETQDTVALMELKVARFKSIGQMLDVSDEDEDTIGYTESVNNFCAKHQIASDIDAKEWFNVCIMQTFYINPEFRGNHLSDYLILQIPNVLGECGYDPIVRPTFVVTNPRPYKDVTDTVKRIHELPNNLIGETSCYTSQHESSDLKKAMIKGLKFCGFEECLDDYVTIAKDMYKLSRDYIEELRPILNYEFL